MATTTATATAATLADLVWGFSGPAAVRPGRWIGGFPGRRRSGRDGVGLGVFPAGGGPAGSASGVGGFGLGVFPAAHFSIGFQLYRTFFYRIPVVPHIFL